MKYRIIEEYGLYFIQYKDGWLSFWEYVRADNGSKLGFLTEEGVTNKLKEITRGLNDN